MRKSFLLVSPNVPSPKKYDNATKTKLDKGIGYLHDYIIKKYQYHEERLKQNTKPYKTHRVRYI